MMTSHHAQVVGDTCRFLLVMKPDETHMWACSDCRLLGYGYTTEEGAIAAGLLHAREMHPTYFEWMRDQATANDFGQGLEQDHG